MKIIDRIPKELLDAVNDFSKRLEWARRLPIYEVHKWWARRYSGVVRLFLAFSELDLKLLKKVADYSSFVSNLYYNPPKVINKKLLDPFAGGGTILIEGNVLGYECFGIEINKLAFSVLEALKELPYINLESLECDVKRVAEQLLDLWKTKCHEGHDAFIIHTYLAWKNKEGKLQVKINKIKSEKQKAYYFCEDCHRVYEYGLELDQCVYCGNKFNKNYTKVDFFELFPYAIEYYCPICDLRSTKQATTKDIHEFNRELCRRSTLKILELNETKRLLSAGFRDFGELFTPRQFATFKLFLKYFDKHPYNKFARILVSDAVRSCSILAHYSAKYTKVIPAFVIKSYWLPLQPVELNPVAFRVMNGKLQPLGRGNIISAFKRLKKAKNFLIEQKIKLNYRIYCGPSQDILPEIRESFDIIFTDPPYANYQYYSDLSLLALSLIGEINENSLTRLLQKEIVLRNKKGLGKYKGELYNVFFHAVSKLKKDGRLIVTFHHDNEKILHMFLEIFKNLPIKLHAIYPVIGESSGKLVKRKVYLDLIFVFGKNKQKIYYEFTTHKITAKDHELQDIIIKLVDFYED